MIGRLSGRLIEKQAPFLLIDVNGVGYEVQAPMTSFYPLPDIGGDVVMYTHLSITENAHQLFAFYTAEERLLFRTLIKVNGVGAKMALMILSGMAVNDFVQCIKSDNVVALTHVPGIGKKTAERLIIEVRDRLKDWKDTASTSTAPTLAVTPEGHLASSAILADAESALIALGYKPAQAAQMVTATQHLEPLTTSEALIRLSLKQAAG